MRTVEEVSQRGSLLLFHASGDLQAFLIKFNLKYQLKSLGEIKRIHLLTYSRIMEL